MAGLLPVLIHIAYAVSLLGIIGAAIFALVPSIAQEPRQPSWFWWLMLTLLVFGGASLEQQIVGWRPLFVSGVVAIVSIAAAFLWSRSRPKPVANSEPPSGGSDSPSTR